MDLDRKETNEPKTKEERPSNSGEKEAPPLDIEALARDNKEGKKRAARKLLGLLFGPRKVTPRAEPPADFKDKTRKAGALIAVGIVGFVFCIYFFSTSNKDIEQQKQQSADGSNVIPPPALPAPAPPVEKQLAPITERQPGVGGDDDVSRKGSGHVVTPDEVLQTADPQGAAISPQQQMEHWRRLALFWKDQAQKGTAQGQKHSTGNPESGAAGKYDLKTYTEFEKDIQDFLVEKERNKTGSGEAKGYDLAAIQPDFSKVPDIDRLNLNKPESASMGTGSGTVQDPGKHGDGNNGPSPTPTAASAQAKANVLDTKSLVFLREEKKAPPVEHATVRNEDRTVKSIPLATRLKARLQASVSTAVDMPAVAIIEHNYVREGDVVIPAGSKAFGRLTGANRNGMVSMTFESILTPENKTIKINGLAQGLNGIGPLRGEVSGKNTGKKILARTVGTLGGVGALVAGHPGGLVSSRAYSYGDYMRDRLSYGIMGETERALANLDRENIVVSVPANTRFEIILMSTVKLVDTDE